MPPAGWLNRCGSVAAVVAIVCLATPALQPWSLPFPFQTPLVAVLALGLLWLQRGRACMEVFRPALARPLVTLLIADALALFVLVVLSRWLLPFLLPRLLPPGHEQPEVASFASVGLGMLFRLIASAWLSAAIAEEIVFRWFLLEQGERLFGRSAWARGLCCVLAAVAFAGAHSAQGAAGMLSTGLVGLSFCASYYLGGKNLPALMLAHGFIDSYALIELYKP